MQAGGCNLNALIPSTRKSQSFSLIGAHGVPGTIHDCLAPSASPPLAADSTQLPKNMFHFQGVDLLQPYYHVQTLPEKIKIRKTLQEDVVAIAKS